MTRTLWRSPGFWLFAAVIAIGLVSRVYAAFDDGIYWPDEIYQSLEMGHRLVFGHGLVAWEFIEGARNWSMPALIAVLLEACASLGLDTPLVYVRVVKIFFALLSVGTGLGVYRLGRALGATQWASFAGSTLWLLSTPVIYFAPRALSDNASVAPLVWGTALLFEEPRSRRKVAFGASLLGLAVLFRLQNAVVPLTVLLALAMKRDFRTLRPALSTLAVWALIYGALDAVTWHSAPNVKAGGWFHSAVVYARFNAFGGGDHFGTAPWNYYFEVSWSSMPATALLLLAGVVGALIRRRWLLPLTIAVFFCMHLPIGHKELRYLLPAIAFGCACVAVAFSSEWAWVKWGSLALTGVCAAMSLIHLRSLTMGEIGVRDGPPESSAWDNLGAVNRLLLVAGRRADLCGIRIDSTDLAWTGGSTYLHKRARFYRSDVGLETGFYNYVIAAKGLTGAELIAEDRSEALYRLPSETCTDDPGYTWRL